MRCTFSMLRSHSKHTFHIIKHLIIKKILKHSPKIVFCSDEGAMFRMYKTIHLTMGLLFLLNFVLSFTAIDLFYFLRDPKLLNEKQNIETYQKLIRFYSNFNVCF